MKKNEYFSGEKLYGDDFDLIQIKKWYKDEEEGYSGLVSKEHSYGYHELNKIHGFSKLKSISKFGKVLSFGGAYAHELIPISNKICSICVVEPSKKLRAKKLGNKKLSYFEPEISGDLPFENETFDLITCFGVLHHIPNVSHIISEFSRVLKKDGYLLLREPIVSMGNWTKSRVGLTKRERGIPLDLLKKMIEKNDFHVTSERLALFPLTRRLGFEKIRPCNSRIIVYLDFILSKLFSWNKKYHSTRFYHKIRPQSVFLVLKKN
ncbi:class I SAM-dependent methyltransferase [Methanococcoides sp. SA1]|nr:class I SAM-dependent methyltransferase [Methanococcoides sp. SA1]